MKFVKSFFDFYINSSMHVALSVVSMSWITYIEFGIPYDFNLFCFVFFATVTGYNFVKYFGIARFHHRTLASWLRFIQIFSFACFLFMCFFVLRLSIQTILYIGIFGIVTFLYAIPFLPSRLFMDEQKNLRNVGGLKVYVIGLVWSGVTVVLPLLNADYQFDSNVWITAVQRFIFVIILMLPFEIHDLQYDSLKLSTIPQKIGVRNTKICGLILGVVFFILEIFKSEIDSNHVAITLFVLVICLLFLMYSRKNKNDYYSSFWVEGIPVFWLLLHLIF